MGIQQIRAVNPTMHLHSINEDIFHYYGKVLKQDTRETCKYVQAHIHIPATGSVYEIDIEALHKDVLYSHIQREVFGELPIQAGAVYGNNSCLSGIEYHQGSEVNVAISDCLLLLGKKADMIGNSYDASKCIAFYLEQGDMVELYNTTLHYTPIQVREEGFCMLVFLLAGTNTPLLHPQGMLTKKNKWYITHPSQSEKIASGFLPTLLGELIQVNY